MWPGTNKTPARCRAGVARNYQLQLVIQETFVRLRQRMNAAPPTSRAAAAQVPGSGTGEGPGPPAAVKTRLRSLPLCASEKLPPFSPLANPPVPLFDPVFRLK